jgi:hypothetical protein
MTSLEMAHRLSLLQTMALREGTSGKRSIALSVNALVLQCQLRYAASSAESFYYPGPEPFFEPLAVPTVDRAVRSELLFWQVSPRRTAFHDPQYPAKHLPVVASGASFARLLPRQQLPDALPLGIAEKTSGSIGTKRRRRRCVTFAAGVGWFEVTSFTTILVGGVSCLVSCLVGALCDRLVGSTKQRPS